MSEEDYDDLYKRFVGDSGEVDNALKTLAAVYRAISEVADNYRGTGPDLMHSVARILYGCSIIDPSIKEICADFEKAWRQYQFAEAYSLDDAFGIHRPNNWDQEAERFRIQNSAKIYEKVKSHVDEGSSVIDACDFVAKDFPRGPGTIKKMYYETKRRMDYLWRTSGG